MSSLRAGELDKRIKLQRQEVSRGPLGEVIAGGLIHVATVWAKAESVSNKKVRTLDQQQVVETWLFTCRARADVEIDWKVLWSGASYTVRAVNRQEPDRIVITAERKIRHD